MLIFLCKCFFWFSRGVMPHSWSITTIKIVLFYFLHWLLVSITNKTRITWLSTAGEVGTAFLVFLNTQQPPVTGTTNTSTSTNQSHHYTHDTQLRRAKGPGLAANHRRPWITARWEDNSRAVMITADQTGTNTPVGWTVVRLCWSWRKRWVRAEQCWPILP